MKKLAHIREAVRVALIAGAGIVGLLLAPGTGRAAEEVSSAVLQEMLIKTSLMTFNDANLTGNYSVLHDSLAKPFRDEYSVDRLKETFKPFADGHISLRAIVVSKPVLTEEARIDERGALLLHGYFDVSADLRVSFLLDYVVSEDAWKVVSIHVKVGKPDAAQ